jgi:hypothetical protein
MAARAVSLKVCYYFETLMVAGCKQKMAEGLMTFMLNLCLTCYGKQRRHFKFLLTCQTRAVILNLTCYYLGFSRYRYFKFSAVWRTRPVILNLTCYNFEFLLIWRVER